MANTPVNYTGDEANEPQVWTTSQRKRSAGSSVDHNPCGHWHSVPVDEMQGCGDASIGYTTQQMSVNQSQQLTVVNPLDGTVYTWAVITGGGQISRAGHYVAPGSNPNCAENPVIALKAGKVICDTLEIAISGTTNTATAAYSCCNVPYHPPHPGDMHCYNHQGCSGIWGYGTSDFCLEHCGAKSGNTAYNFCTDIGLEAGTTDIRTALMKSQGCCVEMLL